MQAVIDRFEGDYAILLFEEQDAQVDFPKKLLPKTAQEGDIVTFDIQVDSEETNTRRHRVGNLLEKLNRKNKI